jgi:hypothetical protein
MYDLMLFVAGILTGMVGLILTDRAYQARRYHKRAKLNVRKADWS